MGNDLLELGVYMALTIWYLLMIHTMRLGKEEERKWEGMETTTFGPMTFELWEENGKIMSRRVK